MGYIAIPPCLWGSEEEGLVPPTFLSFETNLLSIKRNNNTNAHYGDMAMWQMRGVMVKKEEEERKAERGQVPWFHDDAGPPIKVEIV